MFVTINHKMFIIKQRQLNTGTDILTVVISVSKERGKDFFTKVRDTVYSTNQKREKDEIHAF